MVRHDDESECVLSGNSAEPSGRSVIVAQEPAEPSAAADVASPAHETIPPLNTTRMRHAHVQPGARRPRSVARVPSAPATLTKPLPVAAGRAMVGTGPHTHAWIAIPNST